MKNVEIFVLGGDLRHNYLSKFLSDAGYNVSTKYQDKGIYKFDLIHKNPKVYIFPMPISQDEVHLNTAISDDDVLLEDILKIIPKDAIILGGSATPNIKKLFDKYNLKIIDYLKREQLAILNAVPTAEGAIALAFEELPITLWGSKSLILGSGRIAKILANKLHYLGSDVLLCARNIDELTMISTQGISVLPISKVNYSEHYDVIFNTIPSQVLGENELSKLSKDTLIIDLASKPGGIDFKKASELSLNTIWALSLPGKVAPISSAKYIFETILNIFEELEVGYD